MRDRRRSRFCQGLDRSKHSRYRPLVRAIRRFTVRPVLPPALAALSDLATNLRWSWHPETQDVFAALDAEAWANSGHDPVKTLGAVAPARLDELASDKKFLRRLNMAAADLEDYLTGDRWFQVSGPGAADPSPLTVAYFSPEF